jgi:TrpR-related protein YerC/YecD
MKLNRPRSPREEAEAEEELYAAIVELRSVDEARRFFEDLCTPAERQALADRWAVVPLLAEGLPYRRIHELTGVSVTTIGRVARCLTEGAGGYRAILARVDAEASAGVPGNVVARGHTERREAKK